MVTIRHMNLQDLPLCRALTQEAGWNQLDADWHRALHMEPSGCFVAEYDHKAVGTTTTCIFESVGWIAMVLVKKEARGLGIATHLLKHAIDYLHNNACETIRLDATALGRPVYEKLGFRNEYEVVRFQGMAPAIEPYEKEVIRVADSSTLDQVVMLDQKLTGTRRHLLFHQLMQEHALPIYVHLGSDGCPVGYAAVRKGAHAIQIGPVGGLTFETGLKALNKIVSDLNGQPVFMDIPAPNAAFIRWARMHGLAEQRRFTRMYSGNPVADQPHLIVAGFGPEKG